MTTVVDRGRAVGRRRERENRRHLHRARRLVVRYGGGPNAGHTLVVGNDKLIVRLVPSGILRPDVTCVLAQGMVIDPRAS